MQANNSILLGVGLGFILMGLFGGIPFLSMRTKTIKRAGLMLSLASILTGLVLLLIGI
jgi:hypothetical protein